MNISDYIDGSILETERSGNIFMYGNEIFFNDIEFSSRAILNWNSFSISSKDISIFLAKNDDDTTYKWNVEEIKYFNFSCCTFSEDVYFNLSDNCNLSIDNCIFEKNFSINKHPHPQQKMDGFIEINQLVIEESTFKKHFSIDACIVNSYRIKDVEFEGDARLFHTTFKTMFKNVETEEGAWFSNTVFYKSAIFEKVIFKEFVQFKYTIFKGYTLFRDVKFEEGLDLDYANVEKEINFYNLEIGNTPKISKETFRIIKNQFEKIGNKIEANKYHSLELGKYKEELKNNKTNNWKEYSVFQAHWISSEHSTNWFRAFWLIGLISLLTSAFLNLELITKLFFHPNLFKPEYIYKVWNEFWQYAYILNEDKKLLASPLILLFNKMSLSYLYYQFLTSVRKNTSIK